MKLQMRLLWTAIALAVWTGATGLASQQIRLRIGTVVPRGSLWYDTLQYIAQDWRRIVGPDLRVVIHPDSQLGDESDMVRKARGGIIDAVGLSSVGLSRIDSGVSCLQVPMMIESYDELDYVRERVAPDLERRIEARGFKVLHWADGGWVYVFTKQGVRSPDDLRPLRMFTAAGDPDTERLYKEFGFNVVPHSATDLVPMLQAGKLDAFAMPPLFAQLQELFKLAPNMTDVRWVPLVGGTVITLTAWGRLPESKRDALLEAARKPGERLRADIRRMGEVAVTEMQKRGLRVVEVDAATRRSWQTEAEGAYPKLRGGYCPADVFDEVRRLRDEFRAKARRP
ncbi:MAG: TRAP transporter substrate-binding protein DctP [Acidobacteriota bacterium]|nr:TRAP transporter substrate-binding protein DctP [Acidobacteriota bacterium]